MDLHLIVREANALEPLPPSVSRLVGLFGDEGWSINEVERIVALDPGLTGRLLRVANSVSIGGAQTITSVRDATMRMGAGAVIAAAVGTGVSDLLERPLEAYGAEAGDLWRHSVAAALAVESLRPICGLKPAPEVFTAALLHDIGKLVLCAQLDSEFSDFLRRAHEDGGMGYAAAETELLDVNHAELGGLIARHWELPEVIAVLITHHHDPESIFSEKDRLSGWMVSLADHVATTLVPGLGEGAPTEAEVEMDLQALSVDRSTYDALVERVEEQLDATLASYA